MLLLPELKARNLQTCNKNAEKQKNPDMKEKNEDVLESRWLYEELNEFYIRKANETKGIEEKVQDMHGADKEIILLNNFRNGK